MFVLLSPAKTLIEPPAVDGPATTEPALLDEAEQLVQTTRAMSPETLKSLMGISDKLAALNHQRFQSWSRPFTPQNARQALLSFNGDVYHGLDAASLSDDDLTWADDHVGILSGLYGLLRPLDLMQPYRLEMGSKLETTRGADLYAWWGDRITNVVNHRINGAGAVVNLASNEYWRSIQPDQLTVPVVTPVFRDIKEGKSRTLAFFAKRARGAMTRWIIQQRATDVDQLKSCDAMGYTYDPDQSTDTRWVFSRPQPPPVSR